GAGHRVPFQRWRTFVRNHAQAIIACDFCVVVTATYRLLYVFVVMEHATRRILHTNVTTHPTAPWTLQQLREATPADHPYRFLIHDQDAIFSWDLDQHVRHLGLRVPKTPPQSPQANALCERLMGARRRVSLFFINPLKKTPLRCRVKGGFKHHTGAPPNLPWGQVPPHPPPPLPAPLHSHWHRIPAYLRVVAYPILGGLHHEYRL